MLCWCFLEFEGIVNELGVKVEDVNKDVMLKANIKDVCTLLDTKPNIENVNKALTQIHKELDIKSNE